MSEGQDEADNELRAELSSFVQLDALRYAMHVSTARHAMVSDLGVWLEIRSSGNHSCSRALHCSCAVE
jgi:hypothetical protein